MKLTLPRLVIAILFLSIFAMAVRLMREADTWWHLRTGAWIVAHRAVPQTDPFSHTRSGVPWRIPGWIVQVPMYLLFLEFGYAGLNLFTAFFVTLAFVFVYRSCAGPPLLRAFALLLAAAASGIYWSPRPQIVSFALAAVFAHVLHQYRWHDVNRLWVLPPLMALWANAHGGFAIGVIFLAITLVGQALALGWRLLERSTVEHAKRIESTSVKPSALQVVRTLFAHAWRETPEPGNVGLRGLGWLALTGLACAAAVCLNPSGPEMLLYPFKTVSIGVLKEWIQEWQAPNFHIPETQPFLWLLLATLGISGFSRRASNLTDLLLVCGVAYMSFLACRNMPLLSIVAPPMLTRHANAVWEDLRSRFRRKEVPSGHLPEGRAVALHWVLLAVVVLAAGVRCAIPLGEAANQAQVANVFPVGAVNYIRKARPPGRMFNSYNFGAFLTWELYPDYPVYVDGRTDLYNDAFLREYQDVMAGREVWREVFARCGIRLVLIEPDAPLAAVLRREPGWVLAYDDKKDRLAVVFVKQQ